MATVIVLQAEERPPARERYVLVIASAKPPEQGVSFSDKRMGRHYFATQSERDIAIMTRRACAWADARSIPNIYVRRERY
jgi:hypothetical protein